MELMNESSGDGIGLMASVFGIYFLLPKAYLFMIVAFGIAMYRRSIYGKEHEKATLAALLIAILGTVTPVFLFILSFIFDKGYLSGPFFLHSIFVAVIVALYLYIKDFGSRMEAGIGLATYAVGSLMLVLIETFILYVEGDVSPGLMKALSALSIPWAIMLVVGLVFVLVAYIKGLSYVKAHKPKIDDQQAEQISIQREQFVMQKEQLEMQRQQIELLERSVSMLTEMRADLIEAGTDQIPDKAVSAAEAPLSREGPG